ncbi:MAG TPA: hypothetical protein VGG18_17380 [Granulicella sp.]|jgi:hypothetical protein
MGMRQMTFDIPDEVAERFNSEVPASEQSGVVAKLLLRRRTTPIWTDEQLAAACDALNADPNIAELERDMDALSGDGLDEYPWDAPASR